MTADLLDEYKVLAGITFVDFLKTDAARRQP
jgi:hypothetical protein